MDPLMWGIVGRWLLLWVSLSAVGCSVYVLYLRWAYKGRPWVDR